MTVSALKTKFHQDLDVVYDEAEKQNVFHLLAEDIIGMSRLEIAMNPQAEISSAQLKQFEEAMERLKSHEPIQYVLGKTEFFDLEFNVNKHVLIPRPETEGLIRWILEEEQPNKVIDLCTGSGCIAISLKSVWEDVHVDALDVSVEALKVAKSNATMNSADINFIETNLLETQNLPSRYDIIVSNPPYVRELEKSQMRDNVLSHEPHLALFVKDDEPLIFYEKIAVLAKSHLNKKGSVFLEINEYLGEETKSLFLDLGFKHVEVRRDIFGRLRMLKATM